MPSVPLKGAAFGGWESLSEKNQHISNLFFRPDRKLSFQIQTALKIILARHEYQLLPLHLMICPRRLGAAHDSASAYQPSQRRIPRISEATEKLSCWASITSFSAGKAPALFNLMVDRAH